MLDGLTLNVPVGMRLLLVSEPDGSGSLLLRILAGLATPDEGRVELAGLTDPSRAGWARRVAYVGAEPGLRSWMTVRATMDLAAELHGLAVADGHRERLVTGLELRSSLDQRLSSGGAALAQRVALAAALLGDPEVLLLDEPLAAIEPAERTRILRIPGRRRTMLLASRDPAGEVGHCTHVALIRDGRLALLSPLSELRRRGLPLSPHGLDALAATSSR